MTEPLPAGDAVAATDGPLVVRMGDMGLARGARSLKTVGLGSCLAIVIFAPAQQLAALAHCMLPLRDEAGGPPAKYTDTAVPALLALLQEHGGASPLSAVLVGGASMFPGIVSGIMPDIAAQNVVGAREALQAAGIPVRAQDVGGQTGRSVLVEPATQRVVVHTIREGQRCL
jgi:chemotaxis protein CheD